MGIESKISKHDFNYVMRTRKALENMGKESLVNSCALLMVHDAILMGAAYEKAVQPHNYCMTFVSMVDVVRAALELMRLDLNFDHSHELIYRLCTIDTCLIKPRDGLAVEGRQKALVVLNEMALVVGKIITRFNRPGNQNIIDALRSGEFLTHKDTDRRAFTAAMAALFEDRLPSLWLTQESNVLMMGNALEFYAARLKEFHGQGIPGLQKARARTVEEFRQIHRHILDDALDSYLRVAHS